MICSNEQINTLCLRTTSALLLSRSWSPVDLPKMTQPGAPRPRANGGRWVGGKANNDSQTKPASSPSTFHMRSSSPWSVNYLISDGHTTEQCRSLHYLVKKLIRARHLKQYVRSEEKRGEVDRNPTTMTPITSAAPRLVIKYIHGWPIDKKYNSKRKTQRLLWATSVREQVNSIQPRLADKGMCPIDGVITFSLVDPNRVLQPYQDVLILTLGISDFYVRQILVDPGNSVDLLQMSTFKQMGFLPSALENLGWILSGFNGASTTPLGYVMLLVKARSVTLNVQFLVVEGLSPFNTIMGRTWLHGMKVILSTYHQMVSYLIEDGQINLYGSQLVARQCYQVAREFGSTSDNELPTEPAGVSEK